jgi:Fur family ferric uptake transcriptional regulator
MKSSRTNQQDKPLKKMIPQEPSAKAQTSPSPSLQRRNTRQKQAIIEALQRAGRPLNPTEILTEVLRSQPKTGIATIYRSIKQLKEESRLETVGVPGHSDRYELKETVSHHHHHFQCDSCGKVFDIEGCIKGINTILPAGFIPKTHEIIWFGNCATCN